MSDGIDFSVSFAGRTFPDVESGVKAFADYLASTWAGEFEEVKGALREYLDRVAKTLYEKHNNPWPSGTSAATLSSRTGQGAASIVRSVSVEGTSWNDLRGSIGGLGRLAIHESGGTIKASGKLLTIPLPAALSPRGTSPPFARQWRNTFVARSRKGNLIIFQKQGGQIVPLYLLVSEVKIPARLGMGAELQKQLPYFMERAMDRVAEDFMRKMGA